MIAKHERCLLASVWENMHSFIFHKHSSQLNTKWTYSNPIGIIFGAFNSYIWIWMRWYNLYEKSKCFRVFYCRFRYLCVPAMQSSVQGSIELCVNQKWFAQFQWFRCHNIFCLPVAQLHNTDFMNSNNRSIYKRKLNFLEPK